MNNSTKILIAVVVTALLTFFLTKECSTKYELVGTTADTTKTTKTKITVSTNSFSAEQIGKIKRRLIDSLSTVYKAMFRKNKSAKDTTARSLPPIEMTNDSAASGYDFDSAQSDWVYVSEIDTNFVAKDSTGNVTDSMKVKSTFISPTPLPENSIHTVSVDHKSFNKETETNTTITNTNTVEKKRSFFDRFKIEPNVSAGYGITSRVFDVYIGVGIKLEF